MKCNDFPGVVYSRLIAFGKKRENKTHGKISHSTVLETYQPKPEGLPQEASDQRCWH